MAKVRRELTREEMDGMTREEIAEYSWARRKEQDAKEEAEEKARQEARDKETAKRAFLAAGGTEAGFPAAWEQIRNERALDAIRKADAAASRESRQRMHGVM